jgi:hypothetical protein
MKKAGMLTEVTREIEGKEATVFVGSVPIADEVVPGRVSAWDIVDMETGEILVECNEEIDEEKLQYLLDKGVHEFETLYIDNVIWVRSCGTPCSSTRSKAPKKP